eukprot:CAMPEP_0196594452 /NCGR_PEP_ID=MMETSP1081-20130531/78451_1 /TAXON_ID=36882 /ORGANISM="Pyramimonas amylifera, Strain CCMP720" /LENGTH=327 /DNA_ID=CAMNT_0041918733 /DNA_START=186 /DNA_END=1169 /DNA_ORIENTATION=-
MAASKDKRSVVSEATMQAVRAAQVLQTLSSGEKMGIWVLVAGSRSSKCNLLNPAVQGVRDLPGVDKVLVADHPAYEHQLPAPLTSLLNSLASSPSHLIAPGSCWGTAILPRVAATLGAQPLSQVHNIIDTHTFQRPMYAGAVLATVQVSPSARPVCFTVCGSSFPATAPLQSRLHKAEVEELQYDESETTGGTWLLSEDLRDVTKRPALTDASVVVSGGRGVKTKEQFGMLEALADKLGGAVGVTRVLVDAGMAPHDLLVGQSGKIVSPKLYIAAGISGAVQHLAGIQASGTVVAINNDPHAPIFQVADYGLIADLNKVVPELTSKL